MTHSKQSGLVSIIVVMFTAILLMVVSTGFIRIMVQEESRASNNNLSRTAYESAVAGRLALLVRRLLLNAVVQYKMLA